jgi:hypothetical protein
MGGRRRQAGRDRIARRFAPFQRSAALIKSNGMAQPESSERGWVWLLCLLAATHVFIYAAAFPFFNNVDEPAHFDLTVKYSRGEMPRRMAPLDRESLRYIAIYSSQEFLASEKDLPGGKIPPPIWLLPPDKTAAVLEYREAAWQNLNHETAQPPLYFLLAGSWWRMEKLFGLDGGRALYGLRFLNLFLIMALVWLGYSAARLVFPENKTARMGVPALLAFLPQTAFYSILNDALSPLTFGAAFILLVKFSRAEIPGPWLGAATGLALAATFLTKLSNLPLVAVSALFVIGKTWQLTRNGKLRASRPAILCLVLCAGIPMAGWLAWCKLHFGDYTGSAAKIQFLGWTHKPFAEWWQHPIFTLHGFWTFVSGLLATFWQGEFMWHRRPLAWPAVDLVYVAATVVFIGVAAAKLLRHPEPGAQRQVESLRFGFACLAATVVFLGFLSLVFDFHDCFYPSREHPYFTSGRLMLGALIPFMLLFVFGMDRALGRGQNRWLRPLALAAMILFMLVSEFAIDRAVFPDPYNWFHL